MKIRIVLLALAAGSGAFAQSVINGNRSILGTLDLSGGLGLVLPHVASDPSGSCTQPVASRITLVVSDATQTLFVCNGTWHAAVGVGVGGGLADPGSNGMFKRTSLNTTAPAVSGTDFEAPGAAAAAIASSAQRASNLSDLANAGTARTNLGLGTAATQASSAFEAAGLATLKSANLSDLASAATARTNLGLGTAATQATGAFDAAGAATTAQSAAIAASAQRASNLSDLASAATARTNLGLGTAATSASSAFEVAGAAAAVSSTLTTAIGLKANLASPTFTGVATSPSFVGPLTGNASTSTALATDPTDCTTGFTVGINASGVAQGCITYSASTGASTAVLRDGSGNISGAVGNFTTIQTTTAASGGWGIGNPTGTIYGTIVLSTDPTADFNITIPNTGNTGITLATLTDTQTMSGKTFTSPTINGLTATGTLALGTSTLTGTLPSSGLTLASVNLTTPVFKDSNGSITAEFDTTASQVNHVRFIPSITGVGVTMQPAGTDATIQMIVNSKGSAPVLIGSNVLAAKHYASYTGVPACTIIGSIGAGGTCVPALSNTDAYGDIAVTTGSDATTVSTLNGEILRLTFDIGYNANPTCTFTRSSISSNNLTTATSLQYVRSAGSATTLSIYGGSGHLPANGTVYNFTYSCGGL